MNKNCVCWLTLTPALCASGWYSDHPHCASGSVHAMLAATMRQLPAAVYPPPGRVLGGSPAGSHLSGGQSNTEGACKTALLILLYLLSVLHLHYYRTTILHTTFYL